MIICIFNISALYLLEFTTLDRRRRRCTKCVFQGYRFRLAAAAATAQCIENSKQAINAADVTMLDGYSYHSRCNKTDRKYLH